VKVFDNLYWPARRIPGLGVTTSAGIIVIDTIYDYSVEDEVAGGLKKLGMDPANIKYAIVSHGHAVIRWREVPAGHLRHAHRRLGSARSQ
jgi:glyoxylase-like metal-dependent hydrolase (beta-lactamase superfamily II)